jgi:hypothetical protein
MDLFLTPQIEDVTKVAERRITRCVRLTAAGSTIKYVARKRMVAKRSIILILLAGVFAGI